uniref:Peptidoglycan binding-like domain-containing protein n=1 Tax=Noccaea caerulescens TaxID=107243 RepID=A0A1J3IS81_NOCCA
MASSSLPLSLPFPLRSRTISTQALPFRCSPLFLSLPTSIVCFSTQNPSGYDREEVRWLREEQRWIREEQRWIREEQRWIREREALLREISDLQLQIQALESRNSQQGTSVPDTISSIAALLQVLKEKNRISESGSSLKPMVLENTREPEEEVEEEEEEEVEKRVIAEEKLRVISEPEKKRRTLKVGSEGEEVQALQEALLKLGFYSGEEDMEFSSFSSGTARAVKTWQASLDLREDGIMTPELLQKLFMDQITEKDKETNKDKASTTKQEEAGNGAVKTQVFEKKQQSIIKDQSDRESEVSEHRVFLLGENRWEDPSRLNKPVAGSKSTDTKPKCVTCRGEGRLLCLECDGTGEPNIEPQFMEWVGEDTKCAYCEGLGYIVCDVCDGK